MATIRANVTLALRDLGRANLAQIQNYFASHGLNSGSAKWGSSLQATLSTMRKEGTLKRVVIDRVPHWEIK